MRANNPTNAGIITLNPKKGAGEETRTKSKCPATILAASRTARVKGRITDLMISISTINGTNTGGVPLGTRCAIKEVKVFTAAAPVSLNQRSNLSGRVTLTCLDAVNTYGKRPKKLFIRRPVKTAHKINAAPLPVAVWFTSLTSPAKVRAIFVMPALRRERPSHTPPGSPTTAVIETQLRFKASVPTEGSNVLNNLPICPYR